MVYIRENKQKSCIQCGDLTIDKHCFNPDCNCGTDLEAYIYSYKIKIRNLKAENKDLNSQIKKLLARRIKDY